VSWVNCFGEKAFLQTEEKRQFKNIQKEKETEKGSKRKGECVWASVVGDNNKTTQKDRKQREEKEKN